MVHTKTQEIETRLDQLKHAQKQVRDDQANFEVERKRFVGEIDKGQHDIRDTVDDQQNEKAFFEQTIRQQRENLDEQRSQMERDKQLYDLKVRKLRMEMDQARRAYEEMRRSRKAPPDEVHHARTVYDGLRVSLAKLIFKGLSKIIGIPLSCI